VIVFSWVKNRQWAIAIVMAVIVSQLVMLAEAQEAQSTVRAETNEEKVQELLNNKKYSFEDLLHGNPGAVADARNIFVLSNDPRLKQRMASILLSVGVRDQVYRDYLEHAAREALADETPWPIMYDKGEENGWNPVFLEWCQKHGSMPWATLKILRYEIPGPWYYLASSGDPSFYDLLTQGLHAHNLMIAAWAAEGLAKLQDPRAIEPLIAAGRSTPGEGRAGIREALLYFSDPKAQAAAEQLYNPKEKKLLELERQKAKEKGVKGLFQW
jgi:hypothetical protein